MLIKHRTRLALGNSRRRTILKVHAITQRQSTLLAVEDLARRTSRSLNGKTLLGLFAVDGARLADGVILTDTLLPVEAHTRRTGRLLGVSTLLAVELQTGFALRH